MPIRYEENKVIFAGDVNVDELVDFRDFLQGKFGEALVFDMRECESVHFALLQLIMAYKKLYSCSYEFSNSGKIFEKFLNGFIVDEESCA